MYRLRNKICLNYKYADGEIDDDAAADDEKCIVADSHDDDDTSSDELIGHRCSSNNSSSILPTISTTLFGFLQIIISIIVTMFLIGSLNCI